ncbi:aminotransferase-like domain-containing protein [Leucobacter sp. GX24907]
MGALDARLTRKEERLVGSIIDASTALLARQTHDIVRFAMGAPNEELIPQDEFDACFADTMRGRYDYGATEGEPRLVSRILEVAELAGEATTRDRIAVTAGGGQGLDLAFKVLTEPGDLLVVEGPTYTNIAGLALSYGVDLLEAPTDAEGLVVEALPELVAQAGRAPAAIYVIPNFQNPTGTTLNRQRRELLLELAEKWDCAIIDDDPYALLHFSDARVPSFAELSPGNSRVFSVRTFSKTLAPGLRVGWIDAAPRVRELVIKARQTMDTCTSVPVQHAVARFIENGGFASHVTGLRPVYRERRDVMRATLAETFGEDIVSTNPEGGFFLWVTFGGAYAAVDTDALFPIALEEGVAFIPGRSFSVEGNFGNALRLSFATSTPERIREGVARLKKAVDRLLGGSGAH